MAEKVRERDMDGKKKLLRRYEAYLEAWKAKNIEVGYYSEAEHTRLLADGKAAVALFTSEQTEAFLEIGKGCGEWLYLLCVFARSDVVEAKIFGKSPPTIEEAMRDKIRTFYNMCLEVSLGESKGYWLLVQSKDGNAFQKTFTKRITDPKQLDLYGHGHIITKDFKLHIHLYNELQTGVHQTAARLLDSLMIIATRDGLNDTLVILPLKEYMSMRGLANVKETRAQVVEDLEALKRVSFEYKGGKRRNTWIEVHIYGGSMGQIENGDIVFRFNQDFFDSFKASGTGNHMTMYFPREALRANVKYNPYTYWLARKIAEHKRMNIDRPNADIIGVKTLIDACPNFPTYEEVMAGNRNLTQRIIEPFERDMDEITETYSWHYTNGQPLDYKEFIDSTVTITWKDYPSTTKLEIGRAKRAKRLKAAAENKKKKAPAPDGK